MARIYISSTYADLKECRERVYRALRQLRHDVIAIEDYVASDRRPLQECLEDVARCDIYVGIVAWRYGFIPTEDNPDKRSITELEYRHALECGIPTLIFLQDEEAPWPPAKMDRGKEYERIESLRAELLDAKTVSFFRDCENLARLVSNAVTNAVAGLEAERALGRHELAEAERLLGELPLEAVPEVAPLPQGSRMPLSPNPLFVGREGDLKALAEVLKGGETAATTGLGGIGKTQLASAFVHRYGRFFAGGGVLAEFCAAGGDTDGGGGVRRRGGDGAAAGFSRLAVAGAGGVGGVGVAEQAAAAAGV